MNYENVNFKIGISGTGSSRSCNFKISIDDKELLHTESSIDTKFYEFSTDLLEGSHELKITLLDKSSDHILKDESNNLIEDFLLNIESIEIDDIELGNLIWTLSEYYPIYPESYNDLEQKKQTIVKNCVNLGWNGTWILKFDSPVYIWLLENI